MKERELQQSVSELQEQKGVLEDRVTGLDQAIVAMTTQKQQQEETLTQKVGR